MVGRTTTSIKNSKQAIIRSSYESGWLALELIPSNEPCGNDQEDCEAQPSLRRDQTVEQTTKTP